MMRGTIFLELLSEYGTISKTFLAPPAVEPEHLIDFAHQNIYG
jgi:hypothetical protein